MTILPAPTTGTFTAKPIKIARNVGNAYRSPKAAAQIQRRGQSPGLELARYCRRSYGVRGANADRHRRVERAGVGGSKSQDRRATALSSSDTRASGHAYIFDRRSCDV